MISRWSSVGRSQSVAVVFGSESDLELPQTMVPRGRSNLRVPGFMLGENVKIGLPYSFHCHGFDAVVAEGSC